MTSRWRQLAAGCWTVRRLPLVLALVLGAMALTGNFLLYQEREPFHDSMGYHEKIYQALIHSRVEGIGSGISQAFLGNNTTFIPILIASLLGAWVEPSRSIGIGIQIVELWLFLLTWRLYLQRVWKFQPVQQAFCLLSSAAMYCLYYTNGGLSDFRMDLSLALMYAITVLWCLMARVSLASRDFFWFGFAAGLCCLFRATAPIYLFVALTPVGLVDLLGHRGFVRRSRQLGWIRAILVAALTCGWYFLFNFDYLYYYYFVWNTDANAKLPWLTSLGHVKLMTRQLGSGFGLLAYGGLVVLGVDRWRRPRLNQEPPATHGLSRLDARGQWIRLIWFALSPLVLLVGRRMGLNPFVSMPSAFLVTLVLTTFLVRGWDDLAPGARRWLWTLLVIGILLTAGRGFRHHLHQPEGLMVEHRQLIDAMVADCQQSQTRAARFGSLQMLDFETASLFSVILFDHPQARQDGLIRRVNDVELIPEFLLNRPAKTNWDSVSGETDSEKVAQLVRLAAEKMDYLILPTRAGADQIAALQTLEPTHQHIQALVHDFHESATGTWELLLGPLSGKQGRTYELWKRIRK